MTHIRSGRHRPPPWEHLSHEPISGTYHQRVVINPVHTSMNGEVAVWCTACMVTSMDACERHDMHVVLRCDACGATSRVERVTPDQLLDVLTDQGLQEYRSMLVAERVVPGDRAVQFAVMWRCLDEAFDDDARQRRHDRLMERWDG